MNTSPLALTCPSFTSLKQYLNAEWWVYVAKPLTVWGWTPPTTGAGTGAGAGAPAEPEWVLVERARRVGLNPETWKDRKRVIILSSPVKKKKRFRKERPDVNGQRLETTLIITAWNILGGFSVFPSWFSVHCETIEQTTKRVSPSAPGGFEHWPQGGAALWPSPWRNLELDTHIHTHTQTRTDTHTECNNKKLHTQKTYIKKAQQYMLVMSSA